MEHTEQEDNNKTNRQDSNKKPKKYPFFFL